MMTARRHKSKENAIVPLTGKPEDQLDRIDVFKKMCRMLEVRRRVVLDAAWREYYSNELPQQQFIHLMMLRFSLPCNLARIMEVTGLSSAGASILVNKLVKLGYLKRHDDPSDRRNVIINFTPEGAEMCSEVEDLLNRYIFSYFDSCKEKELQEIEDASRTICRALDRSRQDLETKTDPES